LRFVQEVINFRNEHKALRRNIFFTGNLAAKSKSPDIAWYDENAMIPDWKGRMNRLVCLINGEADHCKDDDILILFNAEVRGKNFKLPSSCNGNVWNLVIDTASKPPADIFSSPGGLEIKILKKYHVAARSAVVFVAYRMNK